MRKKNIIKVALIITLMLVLFVAGYTFAKYYSSEDGSVKASVAKWSFVARGNGNVDIDNINLIDTAHETSLVANKIAPGTSGNFAIEVDATGSEVGVDYSVEVSSANTNPVTAPAHLKFYLEGNNDAQGNPIMYDSLAELANNALKGTISANDNNKVKVLNIGWAWPFEADSQDENVIKAYDDVDMQVANGGDYTFNLKIIGEQHKN